MCYYEIQLCCIVQQYCVIVYEYPTNALILLVLLFYSAAPTCFETKVSSSGIFSVAADLYANRMQ
jgi:hypothetical protein